MQSFGVLVAVGIACAHGAADLAGGEIAEPAVPQVHGTKIHRVSVKLDQAAKVSQTSAVAKQNAAATTVTESRGGVSREAPYPSEESSSLFTLLRLAALSAAVVVVGRHTAWGRTTAEKIGVRMPPAVIEKGKAFDKGIDQVFDILVKQSDILVKQAAAIMQHSYGNAHDEAETELRQPLTSSFSDAGSDCDPSEAEQVYDQNYFRRIKEMDDDKDEPTDDIRIMPSKGMHAPQEPAFDPDDFASSARDLCNPCLSNPWGQPEPSTQRLNGDLEDFLDDVEDDLGEHREAMTFPVQHVAPPAEPPQQQPALGSAEPAAETSAAEDEVLAAKARLDAAMANAKAAAEGQCSGSGAKMHEVLTTGLVAAPTGPAVGLDALDSEATAVQFDKVPTSFFDDDDEEVDPMI